MKFSPDIKTFENWKVLIDAVFQSIFQKDDIVICVPGSILNEICDARIVSLPQTNRITAYFETEADKENFTRICSRQVDEKVQYCLKRNLPSILDGVEIRSILYKPGQLDSSALTNRLQEMRQRLSRKEKVAESVNIPINVCEYDYILSE